MHALLRNALFDGLLSILRQIKPQQRRQALFAHAVSSPYRDRSHFDGQNVLETGGTGAYQLKDGWMNRLLGIVPTDDAKAIAVAATVPMALRGAREVGMEAVATFKSTSVMIATPGGHGGGL